jgi:UTP-glucose-1-phosphate uridylyltransferase
LIIPAARYGTRFIPTTKTMPKKVLLIVDKATIQYIEDEPFEVVWVMTQYKVITMLTKLNYIYYLTYSSILY